MELQTFIQEALVQIANGVKNANKAIYDKYSSENETICKNYPFQIFSNMGLNSSGVPSIDFDVAVHAVSDTSARGGAKITVMDFVNIGGEADTSKSTSTQHRIKFSVGLQENWK
jgi:hypothetical protein